MVLDPKKDDVQIVFHCFFKTALQDSFLRAPVLNFYKKLLFGVIFNLHDFQKGPLGTTFSRSRPPKTDNPEVDLRPGADPAFHEAIVITVSFGPSVFFKRHDLCCFSMHFLRQCLFTL